jgi:hypothetical protein
MTSTISEISHIQYVEFILSFKYHVLTPEDGHCDRNMQHMYLRG